MDNEYNTQTNTQEAAEREQLEYLAQLFSIMDANKRALIVNYAEGLAKSETQIGGFIEIPYRTDLAEYDRNAYLSVLRHLDIMTGYELFSLSEQLSLDAALSGRSIEVYQRKPQEPRRRGRKKKTETAQ